MYLNTTTLSSSPRTTTYNYTPNGTFFNFSTTPQEPSPPKGKAHVLEAFDWCLIGVFLLIMVCGVVGNLLVIYVFGRKKKLRNTEHLILYLGVIDLMTSIFNPPLNIYWVYEGYNSWDFGEVACKIMPAIGPIMTTASGWVLLVFAVERYSVIVTPFDNKFTPTVIKTCCMACIFISAGMYVHYMVALTLIKPHGPCIVPDSKVPVYGYPNCTFIIVRLLSFLIVLFVTNIEIYRTLHNNEKNLRVADIREKRIKQSKRIMRILNIMGIVFIILVFPRELLYLVYNMNDMIHKGAAGGVVFGPYIYKLNSWLKVMHMSNSCANVFIYAYMQDSYKRQIKTILANLGCYKHKFKRGLRNYLPGVVNNVQDESYDDDFVNEKTNLKPKLAGRMLKNNPFPGLGNVINNNTNNNTAAEQKQKNQSKFNGNGSVFRKKNEAVGKDSTGRETADKNTTVFFKRAQYFRKGLKKGQFKPLQT